MAGLDMEHNLNGSTVFVALRDEGDEVHGLQVNTKKGAGWKFEQEDGAYKIVPNAGSPAPKVIETSVSDLINKDPNNAFMITLDARGGGDQNFDFDRTASGSGYGVGNILPKQALPPTIAQTMAALDNLNTAATQSSSAPAVDPLVATPVVAQTLSSKL